VLDLDNGEYDWWGNEGIKRLVARFREILPAAPRGLYITGVAGSGKTALAVALANAYNDAVWEQRKQRYAAASEDEQLMVFPADRAAGGARYIDHVMAVDWMRAVNLYRLMPRERTDAENEWIARLEEASSSKLWLIDDFGAGELTPMARDFTEGVIRALYNNSALCIITSNVSLEGVAKIWNEPIRSRLIEMCVPVELTGRDRRGRK
jgi:DNA replication protein DnaC